MTAPTKPLGIPEFVTLLAMMVSILALSIDAMLPALGQIGVDLGVSDVNDTQLIISAMFLGFAAGQIIAGPVSDSFGRKPVIYGGYAVFIVGCMASMMATNFETMLAGRVLQGLGAAAPRIVSLALVRDGYEGRAMARIMSIVMAIFILVPAVAPGVGQVTLLFAHWRVIFGLLLLMAVIALVWFAARQPETLAVSDRRKFSVQKHCRWHRGSLRLSRRRRLHDRIGHHLRGVSRLPQLQRSRCSRLCTVPATCSRSTSALPRLPSAPPASSTRMPSCGWACAS